MSNKLQTLKRYYNRFSVADKYLLMFEYNRIVYGKFYKHIPNRFLYLRERKNKTDLYVRFNSEKHKKQLLRTAVPMGSISDLKSDKYNKGVMAEQLVYKLYNQPWSGKDNIPFYKSGDITVNGEKIQIKFEHARLCYGSTLKRLIKTL